MMRPIIGVTGRRLSVSLIHTMDSRFGSRFVDSFFADFVRCITEAGGSAVHIPFESGIPDVVARLDGLVITGGQDIHPQVWNGPPLTDPNRDPRLDAAAPDIERDACESALIRAAIDQGVPLLGVCRGSQLLNVAQGGTLISDLPQSDVMHYDPEGALTDGNPDHKVTFEAGSLASAIYGQTRQTNSWHHQAVKSCGRDLVISGRATDGVVEAIEMPGRPVLGVQWHPEWTETIDPAFEWLVSAGRDTSMRRYPESGMAVR